MAEVKVDLSGLDAPWARACKRAVTDLNTLFHRKGIKVVLTTASSQGPVISVATDPAIVGTALHGKTSAKTSGSGQLQSADVRLPVKVEINTPSGIRAAGQGVLEVIAAHEFVHALGHEPHTSRLMTQTLYKRMGDTPDGDQLQADGALMPPLDLADDSVDTLKGIWN